MTMFFEEEKTKDWQSYYSDVREVPTRGICGLQRFMYTIGICVDLDYMGMKGRICYDNWTDAKAFLEEWDGIDLPTIGEDGCTAIKAL